MKKSNVKKLLECLKKLRADLHDELDRSKLDELDSIILALENELDMSNKKCLALFEKAIAIIPTIAKFIDILIRS